MTMTFALADIMRSLASVFHTTLETVSNTVLQPEVTNPSSDLHRLKVETAGDFSQHLLREFYAWLVLNHPTKKDIKNLIIIVDEYRRFVEDGTEDFELSPKAEYALVLVELC